MKRLLCLGAAVFGFASPAEAISIIYFAGASDAHSVSGSFSYEVDTPAAFTSTSSSGAFAVYNPSYTFNASVDGVAYSSSFSISVFDAFSNGVPQLLDRFTANVSGAAFGTVAYTFEATYPNANFLFSANLPPVLTQTDATFTFASGPGTFNLPVSFIAYLPETSTWGLLIVGFAVIGGQLRRGRIGKCGVLSREAKP